MPKKNKRWIILHQTICQGWIPYVWESHGKDRQDRPVTYKTEREAKKEVAEDILRYVQEFIDDEREELELCENCAVIECQQDPNGVLISMEDNSVIWSPFENQIKYGR